MMKGGKFPIPTSSMELATILMTLHHEEEPKALLQQTFEALEDGGKLFIREHDANSDSLKLLFHTIDKFYFSVLHKRDDFPIPANYRGIDEWLELVKDVGFTVINASYPEPDNPNRPFHLLCKKEVPASC